LGVGRWFYTAPAGVPSLTPFKNDYGMSEKYLGYGSVEAVDSFAIYCTVL
jgi:hypothetical protein